MDVVLAADAGYVIPLHACMKTVVDHCPNAQIHILDCGLPRSARPALRRTAGDSARLQFVKVPGTVLRGLPDPACGSSATYARLLIDKLVGAARVLFLDADTIVRAPLAELFTMDLAGSPLAAVREMYTPTVGAPNGVLAWRELGLDPDTPYFNAGVMVIDTRELANREVGTQALEYLRRRDVAVTLFDQEALNVSVAGNWKELPPFWNASRYWYKAQRRRGENARILEEARIHHFLSEDKPWLAGNDVPTRQASEFYEALDRTALAGWRP